MSRCPVAVSRDTATPTQQGHQIQHAIEQVFLSGTAATRNWEGAVRIAEERRRGVWCWTVPSLQHVSAWQVALKQHASAESRLTEVLHAWLLEHACTLRFMPHALWHEQCLDAADTSARWISERLPLYNPHTAYLLYVAVVLDDARNQTMKAYELSPCQRAAVTTNQGAEKSEELESIRAISSQYLKSLGSATSPELAMAHVAKEFTAKYPGICFCCNSLADAVTKKQKLYRCSACKSVQYCSADCQRTDWKRIHRTLCPIFARLPPPPPPPPALAPQKIS
jgi:hypothetical protein